MIDPSQSKANFGAIDYGIFTLFLMSSTAIGIYFAWKSRKSVDNREFLTGNRDLPSFPVVMSLAASFMSTNTMLGVPAEVYSVGTQFILNCIPFTIACVLSAEVFMPVFYPLNMTSVNEYLHRRYRSKAARLIGSIGFLFCTLPYCGAVLYGPSLALSAVTPLPVDTCVFIVGAICTFYTSIGGIKAVIWTDVLQAFLMIAGLFMVVSPDIPSFSSFSIANKGGRIKIFDTDLNPWRSDTAITVLSGCLINWCGCYCISQTEVQRFCSTRSPGKARRTLYWNIPILWLIANLAIWGGVVVYAHYADCDPVSTGVVQRYDQLVPLFVIEKFNFPGIGGFFTACLFSGALSTLSSGYNSLAAITWDDLLKDHIGHRISPSATSVLTKGLAAMYGVLSIGMAFIVKRLGTVLQASIAISGSLRGSLFAFFVMGMFFPQANKYGGITGFVAGGLISMSMVVGVIMNPRPRVMLPVSTTGINCTILDGAPKIETILPWEYEPEGMNRFFHISYFYVSVIAFITCLSVGLIVSWITGGNDYEVEDELLSAYALPKMCGWRKKMDNKSGSKQKGHHHKEQVTLQSVIPKMGSMRKSNGTMTHSL